DEHGAELGAHDGAGGAGLQTAGLLAVLADVAEHQPVALKRPQAGGAAALRVGDPLDERDVPPGGGAEIASVVVAEAGEAQVVHRQLVPLLAGDLARLAADAERGIREETHGPWRLLRRVLTTEY